MVVQMVKTAKDKGVDVGVLVGDEDSTTIARVRKEVEPSIEKRSDSNHIKKTLGHSLYSLQKKYKLLSTKKIKYLQKCFNYMVKNNHGNPDGIEMGLKAMSKHPFSDHSDCHRTWCRFIDNPTARYRSLPYGKPLTRNSLQESLQKIWAKFEDQAEKLASLESTRLNESLNNTVSSKAPKTHHYSSSGSLPFRVAASIAQKNVGHTYVSHMSQAGWICFNRNAHFLLP